MAPSPTKALISCLIGGARTAFFPLEPSFPEDTDKPALVIREHRPSEISEWGGTHRLHGILVARAPALKTGAEIENSHLIDIAPTILHLLGVPVPEDMDGRVLTDAFSPNSSPRIPFDPAPPPAPQAAIDQVAIPTKSRPKSRNVSKLSAISSKLLRIIYV